MNGYIYKTDDNLNTWTNIGRIADFTKINTSGGPCMNFYNNVGIIISGNYLHRTIDGGINWVYTAGINSYSNIFFLNESTIWYGTSSKIYKSINSGSTWTSVNTSVTTNIRGIKFLSNGIGYACGSNGLIVKSTDFGTSWSTVYYVSSITNLYDLDIIDENTVWVCGTSGLILFTEDGGATWKTYDTNVVQDLNSIKFYNKVGYCIGQNQTIIKIG